MRNLTVELLCPEHDTVSVEVESSLAPESTFALPYAPEAAVTLQLCACARKVARATAIYRRDQKRGRVAVRMQSVRGAASALSYCR